MTAWATGQGLAVSRVVTEVGSALNGHRKEFLGAAARRGRDHDRGGAPGQVRPVRCGVRRGGARRAGPATARGRPGRGGRRPGPRRNRDPHILVRPAVRSARGGESGRPAVAAATGPGCRMRRYEPPAGLDGAGVQVRPGPDDRRRFRSASEHRRGPVRLQPHARRRQRGQGAARSRGVYGVAEADLTPWQGWSLPEPAAHLERHQAVGRAVVAGVLQGGVQHRPGQPVRERWPTGRTPAPASARAARWAGPGLKRKHAARSVRFTTGAIRVEPRSTPRGPASTGAHPHRRVDPQAGQAGGGRHRDDPVRDRD